MTTATDRSRVLVVDDEPQITRVLKTVLSSQGYQVRTAAEGESALSSLDEWRPELVITDLYMPRMDGVELCRRIRAVSSVPIIVLSVKGEERTKVEALDSGADDYVTTVRRRRTAGPRRGAAAQRTRRNRRRSRSATSDRPRCPARPCRRAEVR
jgi:DNA-binding response OmpR family regulator